MENERLSALHSSLVDMARRHRLSGLWFAFAGGKSRVPLGFAISLPMNDQPSWFLTERNVLRLLAVRGGAPLVSI
jgi:hypothetical protein